MQLQSTSRIWLDTQTISVAPRHRLTRKPLEDARPYFLPCPEASGRHRRRCRRRHRLPSVGRRHQSPGEALGFKRMKLTSRLKSARLPARLLLRRRRRRRRKASWAGRTGTTSSDMCATGACRTPHAESHDPSLPSAGCHKVLGVHQRALQPI